MNFPDSWEQCLDKSKDGLVSIILAKVTQLLTTYIQEEFPILLSSVIREREHVSLWRSVKMQEDMEMSICTCHFTSIEYTDTLLPHSISWSHTMYQVTNLSYRFRNISDCSKFEWEDPFSFCHICRNNKTEEKIKLMYIPPSSTSAVF